MFDVAGPKDAVNPDFQQPFHEPELKRARSYMSSLSACLVVGVQVSLRKMLLELIPFASTGVDIAPQSRNDEDRDDMCNAAATLIVLLSSRKV